eukprot:CAMPEP_0170516842 /NCGR_PEP_ID=MMETSP0209-20121228/2973_1 /TAXON_ID=665100 ORGANISM="Litonotus pictus, Strain P1" /NCGR_SAMPLE_ID=MMETSP0209 /ASSEMBLY_ACC=CAM_ASM_000301 /LENGTH=100 /DNA_ID=CAMNT_0010801899 /DNA_START=239 /DNA_END=538 /DNA_ORIENTATION=+
MDPESLMSINTAYIESSEERSFLFRNYSGFKECNPDSYTKHKDWVSSSLDKAKKLNAVPYCIDFEKNRNIQNSMAGFNSSTILFSISVCDEKLRKENNYL